jgi:hypothetical protein
LTSQLHDYNAGIAPNGLFWTVRVPDDTFFSDGDVARLTIDGLEVVDSFQIFSGTEVPATVSYDITWRAFGGIRHLRPVNDDPTDPRAFAGEFRLAVSTGSFSGSSITMPDGAPFSFEGDASSEPLWGEMGTERNGAFLSAGAR